MDNQLLFHNRILDLVHNEVYLLRFIFHKMELNTLRYGF